MRKFGWFKGLYRLLPAAVVALAIVPVALADSGANHRAAQARPIELGTSGGNINDRTIISCSSGTLGSLVQNATAQYILSNNHVLARVNKASIGEDIIQPGLIDQSPVCAQDGNDGVADLSNFVPIEFKKRRNTPLNTVDAAIAQVRPGTVRTDGSILDIGTLSSSTLVDSLGCLLKKSGRTTGLTTGTISSVNVTVDVNYGGGKVARFVDQFLVTPGSFIAGGDSGSLAVEDVASSPRAVGLLFAGSSSSAVANPIDAVLAAFGVSMVGSGVNTAPCATAASSAQTQTARATKARHEASLFEVPGVVGVGVGSQGAIEVYLERDSAESRRRIPPQLDGVPLRVVVSGEFHAR